MSCASARVLLAAAVVVSMAGSASAQQTTTTSETKKFEVIAVDGNHLVVRLPEGTRELTVPDDFRFDVDGRQLSVRELKAGMKGTATITTKTTVTPVTVTEVRNGTVMQASGASLIVRTDQGVRMFSQSDVDKRGVRIMREGKPATIADFRSGDQLTATIVTSKPPRVVSEKEVTATLAKSGSPSPGAAPPAAAGAQPAATAGATPPAAGAPAPPARKLPKTASPLPLLGVAGLVSLVAAAALRRRRVAR